MRPRRIIILTLIALALAGCTHQPAEQVVAPPPPPPAGPVLAYVPAPQAPYHLGAGDKLRIVVFGQEGLTNGYTVGSNGTITMPLIGTVQARGRTSGELMQTITARLKDGFVREPHVAVEIEAHRPFFILGEVANPGQYPYVANMTVETAVAIAGGFTPRAYKREVQVTRPAGGRLTGGHVPLLFPVHPGDTLNVAERWF